MPWSAEKRRQHRRENPEKYAAQRKKHRKSAIARGVSPQGYASKQYHRDWHLRKTYGITKIEFDAMFVAQSGKCSICNIHMTPTKPHTGTSVAVDHDHKNGRVRGLLCHLCNIGLGSFRDNTDFLESAKSYLRDKSCL